MKCAVLTTRSYFSYLMLSEILETHRDSISVVIETIATTVGDSAPTVLWNLVRRSGIRLSSYKLGIAGYYRLLDKVSHIVPGTLPPFSPAAHARRLGIRVARFTDPNCQPCLDLLYSCRPELIFAVNLYRLLKLPVLELAPRGVIGIHFGMLPRFRGMSPYMWAMAQGERHMGITAYFMDEGIDTGDIILQESVSIRPDDSAYGLYLRGCLQARHILTTIANGERDSVIPRKPQQRDKGSYFSLPGPQCLVEMRRRGYVLVRARDLFRSEGAFSVCPDKVKGEPQIHA